MLSWFSSFLSLSTSSYPFQLPTLSLAQGKSAEEIRRIFNISNDFSPEEEAQVSKENQFTDGTSSSS